MKPVLRALVTVTLLSLAGAVLPACSSSSGYPIVVEFDKAVSLYESGSVKVLGLPAGKITEIRVVGDHVRVELRIDEDVAIPEGATATIVPQSLIGERYIQLMPAWTTGTPKMASGSVIPRARTIIPVEADEALAAVKEFLDTLDPDATGRLVSNLADDLQGNGQRLNDALAGLGQLASTVASKDEQVGAIIDHFDELMATIATREAQLGRVLDDFATMTGVLADERQAIQRLLDALARLSRDGLSLLTEHKDRLDIDLTVLTRTLQAVDVNLDRVLQLVDAGPLLVAGPDLDGTKGTAATYDPKYHHIDLRTSVSPTAGQALGALGLPPICLPVDTRCTPGGQLPAPGAAAPTSSDDPATWPTLVPREPVDEEPLTDDPAGDEAGGADELAAVERPALPTRHRRGWFGSMVHAIVEVVA